MLECRNACQYYVSREYGKVIERIEISLLQKYISIIKRYMSNSCSSAMSNRHVLLYSKSNLNCKIKN
ncbi:hypothetical protein EMGBS15_15910 [Filimonas sp.]|nr:hypothetical protein EMGBS15_10900 [Filimonas sp.]GBL35996.1 hypothetical protein EMGBS15_15910 [Filimonas sp.]